MKKIEVKVCNDCPAYAEHFNKHSGTEEWCTLKSDYGFHRFFNATRETPDWCPLLKEDYLITHRDKEKE